MEVYILCHEYKPPHGEDPSFAILGVYEDFEDAKYELYENFGDLKNEYDDVQEEDTFIGSDEFGIFAYIETKEVIKA